VILVYNAAGKLIETHRHKGDFKEYELIGERPNRRATPSAISTPFYVHQTVMNIIARYLCA